MPTVNDPVISDPFAPIVYANPQEAYQETISNYATGGALAVLIWDLLENISGDYRLLKRGFSINLLAYFGSRLGTLGYILGSAIFATAPTGNCAVFDKIVTAFCPISLTCTGILFFLRLRAIYNRNVVVVGVFLILLMGLFVATVFVPLSVVGGNVGATNYCQDASVSASVAAGQIALLVYDTLIFVAISIRLHSVASLELGTGGLFEVIAFGKHLPAFTRSLLMDGQLYYLITLIVGIAATTLLYAPGIPAPLTSLVADPYLVIINIMACRVYRRTKLGLIRESEISTTGMVQTKASQPMAFAIMGANLASRSSRSETDSNSEV